MARVVIDGYNLLPATGCSTRDRLVLALSVYRKRKGHEITIVFDGTYGGFGDAGREFSGGIEVIFTPLTVTADDWIEALLLKLEPSGTIVVSSDRRIQDAARRTGAAFLSSQEFAARLTRDEPPPRDRPDEPRRDKKGNPRKLPKAERRRRRSTRGL